MPVIHIRQEEPLEVNGEITISIKIEFPDQNIINLWYRVPSNYSSLITASCDPFVAGTIFIGMNQSTDIMVHGEVSPSLLQNIAEFQAAWASLNRNYRPIEIYATSEREQQVSNIERAICAFSGGVDSCFTAFRHRKGLCGKVQRQLEAGLMVHWLGRPLKQKQVFELTSKKSRAMLDSLGMELIPIYTNFREVIKLNWEDVHGAALSSCLMLFQKGYTAGLIASSDPYNALNLPYGSNPITDPMLSSKTFQIVHDGAAFSRIEKIREIANWPEALQHLMVCWEGEQADRNCGRCEKCLRTILGFRVMGVALPPCFEQDVTIRQILTINAAKKSQLIELYPILEAAKSAHISDAWVWALEQSIKRNQFMGGLKKYKNMFKNFIPKF